MNLFVALDPLCCHSDV